MLLKNALLSQQILLVLKLRRREEENLRVVFVLHPFGKASRAYSTGARTPTRQMRYGSSLSAGTLLCCCFVVVVLILMCDVSSQTQGLASG